MCFLKKHSNLLLTAIMCAAFLIFNEILCVKMLYNEEQLKSISKEVFTDRTKTIKDLDTEEIEKIKNSIENYKKESNDVNTFLLLSLFTENQLSERRQELTKTKFAEPKSVEPKSVEPKFAESKFVEQKAKQEDQLKEKNNYGQEKKFYDEKYKESKNYCYDIKEELEKINKHAAKKIFENENFIYFDNTKSTVKALGVKSHAKKSNFIENITIDEYRDPSNGISHPMAILFSLMNIDKEIDIENQKYLKYNNIDDDPTVKCFLDKIKLKKILKVKYPYELSKEQQKDFQKEVVEGLALTYKIHLQIKEEYLIKFFEDILDFISTDEIGQLIHQLKIIKKYMPGVVIPIDKNTPLKNPVPVIILYLEPVRGTRSEKNKYIARILNAILDRYKNCDPKEIGLNITPRCNRKINEFLYVAQGEGQIKARYYDNIKSEYTNPNKFSFPENNVFTDDFAFYKDYDFDMNLIKK